MESDGTSFKEQIAVKAALPSPISHRRLGATPATCFPPGAVGAHASLLARSLYPYTAADHVAERM